MSATGLLGPNLVFFADWLSAVYDLSHTLIVFNSAINFLIYVAL